jgi:PST family polysaccharide transporter
MLTVGSAKSVAILISIFKMKALAVLLGPSGVGLLSIFDSLKNMVQRVAGLGMGSSGVREIAAARDKKGALSSVRRVLFLAHILQGLVALLGVWILREVIATWLFGDDTRSFAVGLVGLAILLSLLASAQTALLQGLRKIGDLSKVTVIGSLFGAIVGLCAVWFYGEDGLIWFVLAQPMASVCVAFYCIRGLPKISPRGPTLAETWSIWKPMAKLGVAFMLGGLLTTFTLLIVRGIISQKMGLEAAGHFAAAWGITMTYLGFLLGAISADYYPRLCEVINDRNSASRLINDQAQLAVSIGGPLLLLLIGLAPWVISLLYSQEFQPAVSLLQWQTVGNFFKLTSWSLSFSIVAAARPVAHFFLQLSFNAVFLAIVLLGLPLVGLELTAYAFVLGYIVYFIAAYAFARKIIDFRWQPLSLRLLAIHMVCAFIILGFAEFYPLSAAILSVVLAIATSLLGVRIVLIKIGPEGRVVSRFVRFYKRIGWPLKELA